MSDQRSPADAPKPFFRVPADPDANNVMRHDRRALSSIEEGEILAVKDKGLALHSLIKSLGASRELSIAATKVEEAVMWATKHITA